MRTMLCGCGEPVDLFQPVYIRNIHRTWLTTLLRDQNARRAGKYLSNVGVPTTVNTRVPTYGALSTNPRKIGKWKSVEEIYRT